MAIHGDGDETVPSSRNFVHAVCDTVESNDTTMDIATYVRSTTRGTLLHVLELFPPLGVMLKLKREMNRV